MQYHTDAGPIAHKVAEMEVARAPKQRGKSGYPDRYRNDEGNDPLKYELYEPWEHMTPEQLKSGGHCKANYHKSTQVNGGYPTGGFLKPTHIKQDQQPPPLHEYPVSTKPAGHVPFDYNAKPTPAKRAEAPITKGDRKALAVRPFNDPGIVRANVSRENGQMVGVTYHPEGNSQGFVRAPMGPLDRETAQHMRQHQDMDSRPEIRKWNAANRGILWDESHPNANRRIMTMPGREQGSEVMTDAIDGYAGGRRPNRWRGGQWDNGKGK
ncbi:hypothetical protein N0V93_009908 [Gnomoniopsis smithogilvyi]|uniref:Uncharacterized protein n=1 Tax=Gnomoniopsis smithogilvyi TaxID=1191159 RepID=A0A9W9CSS5_9PEZI|nr:hypothetical protein N0V93_009908 [Gnomoniopsis smithogilvyi]